MWCLQLVVFVVVQFVLFEQHDHNTDDYDHDDQHQYQYGCGPSSDTLWTVWWYC